MGQKTNLMMRLINRIVLAFRLDDRGSATLESMMVFPIILAVLSIMMLVVVYGYQQVYVQHISLTAAERASYNWDARDRSFRTAQPQSNHYYGLYENELAIVMLRNWIAVSDRLNAQQLDILRSSVPESMSGKLVKDTLVQTQHYIVASKSGVEGQIQLNKSGFIPRISVQLRKDITPLFWQQQQLLPSPSYTAHHDIYAPTQFIRNVDLFLHYANEFSSLSNEQQRDRKQKGGKALRDFSS